MRDAADRVRDVCASGFTMNDFQFAVTSHELQQDSDEKAGMP